jgi:hypothetical protein
VQNHQRQPVFMYSRACASSGAWHPGMSLALLGALDRRPGLKWRLIARYHQTPQPAEALFGRRW